MKILQVAGLILLLASTAVAATSVGDGNMLRRSSGDICEGCHRTSGNTPSPGETGFNQTNWDNALKMHSAEIAGSCSDVTYETKTACEANAGVWTPGKWGPGGWGVFGGQYGEFTCATCHTSHDTTNIYLIKPNISATSGSLPGSAVDFRYLGGAPGSAPYAMGDDSENHTSSTRICEVCHTVTSYHRYDTSAQSNKNHNNAADCTTCHNHRDGFIPFGGACNSCHGASGDTGAPLILSDLAQGASATGSITAGKHQKHVVDNGYACDTCHTNYSMPDNTNHAIDIGFNALSHTGGGYDGQVSVQYVAQNGSAVVFPPTGAMTCSNIYCHSTGQSTTNGNSATPTYAAPTWTGTVACGDCHKVTEVSGLTSGSHGAHLGATGVNGCGNCHTGAANDASLYNSVNHVNASIDVSNTYSAGGAPGNGYGTCSAASCHEDGRTNLVPTPTWGNTVTNCSECHANQPTTGSHSAHLSASVKVNGISILCANCHNDAVQGTTEPTGDHLDTNIDVKDTADGDLGYTANKPKNTAFESCSTASCHTNGQDNGGIAVTQKTTATWGTAAGCAACHDFNGSNQPTSGSHSSHITRTSGSCVQCHDVYGNGTEPDLNSSVHINSIINVLPGGTYTVGGAVSFSYNGSDAHPGNNAPAMGYGTCSTVSCHGGGAARIWGQVGNACNECHSNTGTALSGVHASHTTTAYVGTLSGGDYGNTASGWYRWSNTGGVLDVGCGYCHPQSVATHNNTIKNVNLDPSDTGAAGTVKALNGAGWSYTGGVCSQAYCHSNGNDDAVYGVYGWNDSPSWTTGSMSGNCNDCHGNSPLTSSHSKHVVGIHYQDIYTGTTGLATAGTGNTNSHGNTSYSSTINCNVCHSGTVTASVNDKNTVCLTCHNGTNATLQGSMVIAAGSTTHVNGTPDIAFSAVNVKSKAQVRDNLSTVTDLNENWSRTSGYKAANSHDSANNALNTGTMYDSTYRTCSAVACHNGNSVIWGATGIGCKNCHTGMPK